MEFHQGFQIMPHFGTNSHYSIHNSDVTFQLHCRQLWTSLRAWACACVCVCLYIYIYDYIYICCVWRYILFVISLRANNTSFFVIASIMCRLTSFTDVSPVELWFERFDIKQMEVLSNGCCALLLCQVLSSCTFPMMHFVRSGPRFKIITNAFQIFMGFDCKWRWWKKWRSHFTPCGVGYFHASRSQWSCRSVYPYGHGLVGALSHVRVFSCAMPGHTGRWWKWIEWPGDVQTSSETLLVNVERTHISQPIVVRYHLVCPLVLALKPRLTRSRVLQTLSFLCEIHSS